MSGRPRSHVSGRDYLAIRRGTRREPARPFTFDALGLTAGEYDELIASAPRFACIVPPVGLRLMADWPTP
jgi:hypothetical protein